MNLCFYGPETDHQSILELLSQTKYHGWLRSCDPFTDYDSFVASLPDNKYDAVFITENNANGMEGVIAARNICPQIPIVWFSNDEGFGCQAYRLRADFFHAKPITARNLELALSRLPEKTC